MKILPLDTYRELDKQATDSIGLDKLAEEVGAVFMTHFSTRFSPSRPLKVFCGMGNNGLDGLIIARLAAEAGYKVHAYVVYYTEETSAEFKAKEQLLQQRNVELTYLTGKHFRNDMPQLTPQDVVVDAIFGVGLDRPISGFIGEIVDIINDSPATVVAVDIPSGLMAETKSVGTVVNADYTITFNQPKLALLMPENFSYTGDWEVAVVASVAGKLTGGESSTYYTTSDTASSIIKKYRRQKYDHKGMFGHALLVTGSLGKMGAAVLMARAAIRAGAGKVSAHIPRCGYYIMQGSVPEVMVSTDPDLNQISDIPSLTSINAVGIGPGIGTSDLTKQALQTLLERASALPLVIDADALNLLAQNKDWLARIPKGSILTPHPKEFTRLFGGEELDDFARLALMRELAKKHEVFLVYKTANTIITTPAGNIYFNASGNPGMATAGTGDVLTGLVTGLLARGYRSEDAAVLGVYLHGLAGDIAANEEGAEAMIASDVIFNFGEAFRQLTR